MNLFTDDAGEPTSEQESADRDFARALFQADRDGLDAALIDLHAQQTNQENQ